MEEGGKLGEGWERLGLVVGGSKIGSLRVFKRLIVGT